MSSQSDRQAFSRRAFLGSTAAAAALTAVSGQLRPQAAWANLLDAARPAAPGAGSPESLVKVLYDTFTEPQKKAVCFAWDYQHPKMGLLRTRVENNWNITTQHISGEFYTAEQRDLMRKIYEGMLNPEWVKKVDRQLKDDAGGWGKNQAIAMFGAPGTDQFEMVMTGRHLTLRCDGNSAEHVAFGGPIFHGHAASGFHEKADHPNNIFWPQALEANKLYTMLDGKQRDLALVSKEMPDEEEVAFKGKSGKFQGIAVTDFSSDQKQQLQKVLAMLVEPYRKSDSDEAIACLSKQGGLDACHLAFYEEADLGKDKVWDNWRLEGPSFVWHFRGNPHVHIWINVADESDVKLNTFSSAAM